MVNAVIVGLQWGDEGKGKIVDLLCPAFDAVVRYQGGHNAGHTVRFGERHFSLQLVPSGILHPGVECVLGNGMVVAPDALFAELDRLSEAGVETAGRVHVSNRAQVLLPIHATLDQAREAAAGQGKIGTTARGIGPCYEIKVARAGVRMCDLADSALEDLLRQQLLRIEAELGVLGGSPIGHPSRLADLCRGWAARLGPMLCDTSLILADWIAAGKSLLFEGAQGTLLDVDHGTYPFVTSSSSTAGGACTGAGVPPTAIAGTIGVVKAYTTRVGGGPFVGELLDERGDYLRQRGNEFGTVTGRPRRCGWFDAVAVRYAQRLNGAETVALTKLDVLDTLPEIPVCVGYRYRGELLREFPASVHVLEEAKPELEVLPGWHQPTVGLREESELPPAARDYVAFLERAIGAEVGMISTGPRREETILRGLPACERLTGGRLPEILARRDLV